jgi:hypothetical protein
VSHLSLPRPSQGRFWRLAHGRLRNGRSPGEPRPALMTVGTEEARRAAGKVAEWAADGNSSGARRGLQIALGITWLLDAALQYQPFMFGRGFVTQVLAPAQAGNPPLVARLPLDLGHLIAGDVALWNAVFATIQLVLALGLLWRPAVRAALAGSVAWSLSVWWLGEGLGGVLTGSATPVTGAPGAVILYAFLAVLVWPPRPGHYSARCRDHAHASRAYASVADGSPLGASLARSGWLVLWASAAYLAVQAPNRAPRALHDTIAGLARGEPGWLAALDRGVAAAAGSQGTAAAAIVIAGVCAVIGLGILVPCVRRPALVLSMVLALAIWVAGENFGGILTGQGTDPNSGPLLILLAIAFWPRPLAPSPRGGDTCPAAGKEPGEEC